MTQSSTVSFDEWTFHRESGELEKEGVRVRLQDLPLQILNELLVRPGEMVTRADLIAKLWPTGVIDFDASLNSAVRKLRAALDDDADSPRYIETVPRRGYRFIGKIAEAAPIAAAPAPAVQQTGEAHATHQEGSHHKGPWLAIVFGAVALFAIAVAIWVRGPWLAVVFGAVAMFAIAVAIGVRFFGMGGSGSAHVTPLQASALSAVATTVVSPPFNPPAHSIAVLPFVNMSGDPHQEYFSDGMGEELLNSLVRISELKVAARTSAFAFKGKEMEIAGIARKLNVGAILEGSVRSSGKQVRITVQLVDATNGYQLWSQTYDRQLDDIFQVQADIATNVVQQLQATLRSNLKSLRRTPGPEAYAAYLQGNYFFERLNLDKALFYYEQALQLDEYYVPAMVGLAQARFGYGFGVRAASDVAEARRLIEGAIALEPQLVEAYVVRARIARIYDFDWAAAEASMQRARELEPRKAIVLFGMGILAGTLGRLDDSVEFQRLALERDPLNPAVHIELGIALLAVGNTEAAEASFRKYVEISPAGHGHAWIAKALLLRGKHQKALAEAELESQRKARLQTLALVYHALHRKAQSDAALRELTEKYAGEAVFGIAEVYAYRHEADRAMRWLEHAYRDRDAGLTRLLSNPILSALSRDPRYQAFLRKMNLPTHVESTGLSASRGPAAS